MAKDYLELVRLQSMKKEGVEAYMQLLASIYTIFTKIVRKFAVYEENSADNHDGFAGGGLRGAAQGTQD